MICRKMLYLLARRRKGGKTWLQRVEALRINGKKKERVRGEVYLGKNLQSREG